MPITGGLASAQVQFRQPTRRLISQAVDDGNLVALHGNTRPEANAANDCGRADDSLPIEHIQLQLQLPAEKQHELDQLIQDFHNPASPNYHKWLTPDQFRQEFSLAPEDIDAVTTWLASEGFTIQVIYARSIDFSGTAGQVTGALLDTRTISNFANGLYLVWNISGNVTIKVSCNSGPNAVISGVFFN